jgi:hypothetical protein
LVPLVDLLLSIGLAFASGPMFMAVLVLVTALPVMDLLALRRAWLVPVATASMPTGSRRGGSARTPTRHPGPIGTSTQSACETTTGFPTARASPSPQATTQDLRP